MRALPKDNGSDSPITFQGCFLQTNRDLPCSPLGLREPGIHEYSRLLDQFVAGLL